MSETSLCKYIKLTERREREEIRKGENGTFSSMDLHTSNPGRCYSVV
jgi:hypothetical protein